jgi:hypothetical protein
MKYLLSFFLLTLTTVQCFYSFEGMNSFNKNPKIIEKLNKTNVKEFVEKAAFFPAGRIKSFSYNMAKYFTRFAKLAYCNTNIFIKNPICKYIQGQWRLKMSTRYVKVLKSARGLIKKKVIFSCSSPKKKFHLPEKMLIYNETEKNHFDTSFGEFQYFKKFYRKMVTRKAEKNLIKKLFKYLKMDKLGLTQVFFIGHSWGGVICNMLALKATKFKRFDRFKGKDSPVLITYGAPNIGGKKFAKRTEKKIPLVYRIISKVDALPTYPRTIKENENISKMSKINLKDIGKHIVINFKKRNLKKRKYFWCNRKKKNRHTGTEEQCKVSTEYMSYNNKFYFNDNIAGISPKSEFNKVWSNAGSIGAQAYKRN